MTEPTATPAPGINVTAPADSEGVAVLADVARTAAARHAGGAEVAALLVRLLGDDAVRRSSVDRARATVSLAVDVDGTELVLSVRDAGEPVIGPPAEVLALVDVGLASGADGGADGTGNAVIARVPLPAHSRVVEAGDLEVLTEDAPLTDAPVTVRALTAEDAPALTRCVYRTYGWSYPYAEMYYPDRLAAAITEGTRHGGIAVDGDGEVVTHCGWVEVTEGVVMIGGGVTDPRYRRRGLLDQVLAGFGGYMAQNETVAMLSEPVLTHIVTQRMALRMGGDLVGIYLNVRGPIQQVDFTDGLLDRRSSLLATHHAIAPMEPTTWWIPAAYEPLVRHVHAATEWPREFGTVRGVADAPVASVVTSSYDSLNQIGAIRVPTVGLDLVEAIDAALGQLQRAGAEMVRVYLPATQSALATVGAGLGALRLGFSAIIPRYGAIGDALILQWVRDPEIDDSEWAYADERVEFFARLVMAQARELGDAATRERRRQARRQQLLAALPTDEG